MHQNCLLFHHFSTLPGGAKFAQAAQATQAMSMMRQSALGPLPGVEKPKDRNLRLELW